jgi:hypothetical protein
MPWRGSSGTVPDLVGSSGNVERLARCKMGEVMLGGSDLIE